MERREFLKSIGIISVMGMVSPAILLSNKTKRQISPHSFENLKPEDYHKWLLKNIDWLYNWVENAKPCYNHKGMQIFETRYIISPTIYLKSFIDLENKIKLDKKREHLFEIIRSCVFGVGSIKHSYSYHYETMSGFLEKIGRLPNKNDKVYIEYFSDDIEGFKINRSAEFHCRNMIRNYKVISTSNKFMYLSECKLVIDESK
jgi:hypothetical protein